RNTTRALQVSHPPPLLTTLPPLPSSLLHLAAAGRRLRLPRRSFFAPFALFCCTYALSTASSGVATPFTRSPQPQRSCHAPAHGTGRAT
ncbi:hypothetical protein FS749_009353, partial [Ceratobasidium sp. UAMH 11750]